MNRRELNVFLLAIGASTLCTTAFAGFSSQSKLLMFEGGASYSHAYYKNHLTPAESVTNATPNGVSIDADDYYPNNFWGGYIGLSLYVPGWLINTRYDMYSSESKSNSAAGTDISLAPTRFSFTADKLWGCINEFSYGLGAGAVFETVNKGEANIVVSGDNPTSESFQGRTRIDPLIEGFLMYQFGNNIGIKFNVGYQIPLNNKVSNGDLNVNLGLNYALPI